MIQQTRYSATGFLLLLWTLICVAAVPPLNADESLTDAVDRIFAEYDSPGSPGAAVAVVRDGRVLCKRGFGCADLEHAIPITPSTVFDIASVSKQFTGLAVAMLLEEKKVSLDDSIRKYLPEVPDFGQTVTLRHLVHHTSGLRDWPGTLMLAGWRFDDVIAFGDIMEMVSRQEELNFEPGSEYSYSNTGYNLLAEMAARVEGTSFRDLTDRTIFTPLGMKDTFFHDNHEEIVKKRACAYAPGGKGGFKKIGNSLTAMGSSSLFSSVDDLIKWVINFDDHAVGGSRVIEKMEERGVLNSGKPIDYAFGQSVWAYRGAKAVSHSGGWAGFRTYLIRFPDLRFSVIVLSNVSTCNPREKALRVADLHLADHLEREKPEPETKEKEAGKIDPALLDDYTGTWELGPAWLLTIFRKGDSLMAQATAEAAFPAVPEAEDRFYVKAYGASLFFERDTSGKVHALHYRGIRAVRVEPFRPSFSRLKEYCGVFRSRELDSTFTLALEDGKLVAQHWKEVDEELVPALVDQFRTSRGRIDFCRGEGGWIAGFRFTQKRSRNIRFRKVPLTDEDLEQARDRARFRTRRIIMNNDGNDTPAGKITPQSFLDSRTTALSDSQVDSIFYCTGVTNLYTHRSGLTEQMCVDRDVKNKAWVKELAGQGTDPLEIVIQWGKDHGREIFWSMRMNDRHDSSAKHDYLFSSWKKEHPELLMGRPGDSWPCGAGSWSAVRYGRSEVRERVYAVIEDVCTRYDVDGIELDFFRHPVYFVEAMEGKPVPREKIAAMTSLWRRVRAMADETARRRGRPLLIAIRIPDSVDYCRAMGLDVVTWLEEGLVDLIVGCGYFKLEPWENLAALGRKHGVPVYAALVRRRIEPNAPEPEGPTAIEIWRGEALNAWKAGVNGIYTFNRFDPQDPLFRELGDPALLETLDRVDRTAFDEHCTWSRPDRWVKDGSRYVKRPGRHEDGERCP